MYSSEHNISSFPLLSWKHYFKNIFLEDLSISQNSSRLLLERGENISVNPSLDSELLTKRIWQSADLVDVKAEEEEEEEESRCK